LQFLDRIVLTGSSWWSSHSLQFLDRIVLTGSSWWSSHSLQFLDRIVLTGSSWWSSHSLKLLHRIVAASMGVGSMDASTPMHGSQYTHAWMPLYPCMGASIPMHGSQYTCHLTGMCFERWPCTDSACSARQAFGIPFGFETSKGKHVDDEGSNLSLIKVPTTRQARQYMNRRGGFNRPLPAERTGEKVHTD
jgi:U4/U6.U5 small nuclear ribonucleoproteins